MKTPFQRGLVLLFLFLLLSPVTNAQNKARTKQIIDTLTAPYFGGRGYVDSGDWRAARFIASEFKKAGLQPLPKQNSYFQSFTLPVNTFPGKLSLKADNTELKPGIDFYVDPASGGIPFTRLKIIYADAAFLKNYKKEKLKLRNEPYALLLDPDSLEKIKDPEHIKQIDELSPAVYIELTDKKQMWSVVGKTSGKPYIRLNRQSFPAAAKVIETEIDQKLEPKHSTQNVLGYIKGKKDPDSFIFITAHYDHLGKMGADTYFPGANDNASGIAMLLDLAHHYSQPENQPRYSIVFAAFAAEEAGLKGSEFYVQNPIIPLKKISFLINMDLMSNGQDGMMVVNGEVFKTEYEKLIKLNAKNNYLKEIKKRGKAANSDHYHFSENGVKAFFFYLLGEYPHYHDPSDTAEKPTMAGYEGAFKLITSFVKELQK